MLSGYRYGLRTNLDHYLTPGLKISSCYIGDLNGIGEPTCPGLVLHACNPSYSEAKVGGLKVGGQPGPHGVLKKKKKLKPKRKASHRRTQSVHPTDTGLHQVQFWVGCALLTDGVIFVGVFFVFVWFFCLFVLFCGTGV
jgi:hypothetical protein